VAVRHIIRIDGNGISYVSGGIQRRGQSKETANDMAIYCGALWYRPQAMGELIVHHQMAKQVVIFVYMSLINMNLWTLEERRNRQDRVKVFFEDI